MIHIITPLYPASMFLAYLTKRRRLLRLHSGPYMTGEDETQC